MTEDARPANAGVRFPPPLVFIIALVAAWAVDRYVLALPLPIHGGILFDTLATVLLIAGLSLAFWSIATFRTAHTAVIPNRSASTLVTWGPFRYSRNPMYIAMSVAYIGIALFIYSAWSFIGLVFVLIVIYTTVIRREERYLTSAFGRDYTEYCSRVGRWF